MEQEESKKLWSFLKENTVHAKEVRIWHWLCESIIDSGEDRTKEELLSMFPDSKDRVEQQIRVAKDFIKMYQDSNK